MNSTYSNVIVIFVLNWSKQAVAMLLYTISLISKKIGCEDCGTKTAKMNNYDKRKDFLLDYQYEIISLLCLWIYSWNNTLDLLSQQLLNNNSLQQL